ncbi:Hypothetical predicted protein [Cloeon dipterum]|uniref:SF4 helicase domain-containing protein n=1 Tax=Cloeon dipterum TaxID=197152 RepID=A0A8S1C8S7_9INSE|nr:Hypothetical predicted protein [Cloeon dipterum]
MLRRMNVVACARRLFGVCTAKRNVQSLSDVPVVYVSKMKSVLSANKVSFEDGFTCLTTSCPVGCRKDNSYSGNFYVNKVTGLFVCHACGQMGQWQWLERRLSDMKRLKGDISPPVFPEQSSARPESVPDDVLSRFQPASTVSDKQLSKCLGHLGLKHVKREQLARLGAMVGKSEILLPLRGSNQNIGAWKLFFRDDANSLQENLLGNRLTGQLLLSNEEAWHSDNVVLVTSGADLLALTSQKVPAICVEPQLLPQEVLPRLEHFKQICIWFGEHQLQAQRVARKLGLSRCRIVRAPELRKGPHEVLVTNGDKLASKVKLAESLLHPAIVSFSNLRHEVLDAVTRQDKNRGLPWNRFPALTSVLGGFRDGELTILTGPTGSGKTTFLSEYSLDLCQQGVSTLWGSFEIRNTRLAKTMLTQMAGMNLEKNLHRFDEFADNMEQLPLHFLDFHGQQPLKTVMNAVNHAQYVYDLGHVIIDNVQFMLGLGDSESRFIDRFYRQDQVIQAFRSFATATNCHVTLVVHPRKETEGVDLTVNSIFGSAKASQEADNILIIQTTATSDMKQRKFLQVCKNRFSGDLGIMQLNFNKDAMSFAKKTAPVKNMEVKSPKEEEPLEVHLDLGKSKLDQFELFMKTHANMLK